MPGEHKGPVIGGRINVCLSQSPPLRTLPKDDTPPGGGSATISANSLVTAVSALTFGDTEEVARAAITELRAASLRAANRPPSQPGPEPIPFSRS